MGWKEVRRWVEWGNGQTAPGLSARDGGTRTVVLVSSLLGERSDSLRQRAGGGLSGMPGSDSLQVRGAVRI